MFHGFIRHISRYFGYWQIGVGIGWIDMDRLDRLENPGLRSAARKVYYLDFGPPPVMRPLAKPVGSVASWFFRISVGFDPKKRAQKRTQMVAKCGKGHWKLRFVAMCFPVVCLWLLLVWRVSQFWKEEWRWMLGKVVETRSEW